MKHHFLYKTINLVNSKFYIGIHSTNNLDDGYIGSGLRIRYAIKKYGRENFKMEILEYFDDRLSMRLREQEVVNSDMIKDPMCMNLQIGGGSAIENHLQSTKEKIRKTLSKSYVEIYGSEEEAEKQKEKRKNAAKIQWENTDEDVKKKIFESIGIKIKQKRKDFPVTYIKRTCPHCGAEGSGGCMDRWHFNNCFEFTGIKKKGHSLTDEAKKKLSIFFKGRSCESRKGISPSNKGIKSARTTCLSCKKDVAVTVLKRHLKKCKKG